MSVKSRLQSTPSQVINARRTESLDAPYISKLIRDSTQDVFGRVDVVDIIEKAVLAVTLSNEKEEILGHAAFYDYPNIKCIDQAKWEPWLKDSYEETNLCSPFNTLFLHFFVARPDYAVGCLTEILKTAYTAVPNIHFIILNVPDDINPEPALCESFKPVTKRNGEESNISYATYVCNRHDYVPVLHVRNARVEDNDDLSPIFNRQSETLKSIYGDYFLAELIEAQDEEMKCLVVEAEGTACGFASFNSQVNCDLLNECFELAAFHGLRKPHDDDELVKPVTPVPQVIQEEQPETIETSIKESGSEEKIEDETVDKAEPNSDSTIQKTSRQSSATSTKGNVKESTEVLSDAASDRSRLSISSILKAETEGSEQPVNGTMVTVAGSSYPEPLFEAKKRFVPKYNGKPNAFSIQLFCIDEKYETRSMDILSKAFSLYSEYDYCIITIPHLVPEFPLLNGFVRVTPRCPSTLSQELYVFHRSGLLKNFTVEVACSSDTQGIETLVQSLDCHTNLLQDFTQFKMARRDEDGTDIQVFVAKCLNQVVGICIVRKEEDIEYIRSHYNIEDFIYYNHHRRQDHGHLHHFALNPIFSHFSKFFLKEVLRLSHKTSLYYPLYPPYTATNVTNKHTMLCTINDLVPVRTRRQIKYNLKDLGENAPSKRVLKDIDPYALLHINRKLTLEPKVTINARIVVVGASDVGVAFLATLAYCPHLRFNNITLISPHGLPGEIDPSLLQHQMLSQSHPKCVDEQIWLFLRTWVNVVYGKMTGIDRTKKQVMVDSNLVVPYDHVVLSTGLQYQVPCPTEASLENGVTNNDLPNSPDRRYKGPQPNNLYLINDYYDCLCMQSTIKNNFIPNNAKILVYGNNIDAFTYVNSLIQYGVKGENIIMVLPPLSYNISCFNNITVKDAIYDVLNIQGIQIYNGYILANWTIDAEHILSTNYTSNEDPLRLYCDAFVSFYKQAVDLHAFQAINNSCLVYDGKLVVDTTFHTNDVSIRGAGSLTKYQRKYYGDKWTHSNFDSKEIGIALATEMLKLFDPTIEQELYPREEQFNLIPIYRAPKIISTILPGGYHYLHIKKPGLEVPLDQLMQNEDYGKELITGLPSSDQGYFRLHVNLYNSIETITCLTKKEIKGSNLLCLYGLHAKYLNNLMGRFDEGLITDFFSYFDESWCQCLYHDRFSDLRDELRELLITNPDENKDTLEEQIRQFIGDEMSLSNKQHEELAEIYEQSGTKQAVETRLLNYISYNYYHLPMYAKPGMV